MHEEDDDIDDKFDWLDGILLGFLAFSVVLVIATIYT